MTAAPAMPRDHRCRVLATVAQRLPGRAIRLPESLYPSQRHFYGASCFNRDTKSLAMSGCLRLRVENIPLKQGISRPGMDVALNPWGGASHADNRAALCSTFAAWVDGREDRSGRESHGHARHVAGARSRRRFHRSACNHAADRPSKCSRRYVAGATRLRSYSHPRIRSIHWFCCVRAHGRRTEYVACVA